MKAVILAGGKGYSFSALHENLTQTVDANR